MEHSIHLIEILTIVLGGGALLTRILPGLKESVIFFQIAIYLTQLFGFYMKKNPAQQKKLKYFVSGMMEHYLTTHPEGQEIAQHTDIDEKVERWLHKESVQPDDKYAQLCKLLRLKVDKQ